MITANLSPIASRPSLLNGIKPVVEEVRDPEDRSASRSGFYDEGVPPHERAKYSIEALSDVQNTKTETQAPAQPTQSDSNSTDALASKGYTQVDTISAEQASGNILDFVRQGLAEAASRGKSQEELQTMLNQARQGVEEGFAQAIAELKSLGLMGDELAENIQASRDRVEAGIDELEANLFGQASVETFTKPEAASSLPQNLRVPQDNRALEQRMELRLKTREGDVITLLWGRSDAYEQKGTGQALLATSSSSAQLSYTILGDINDQERAELDAFLQASFEFADKFFNQNNDQMMEQALAYVETFNGLESMSRLDLRLTQTKTQQAAATYGQVDQLTPEPFAKQSQAQMPNALLDELNTLKDLADQVLANQTDIWPLFQSLPEMMGAEPAQGQSFLKLIDGLFGRMGLETAA